jgi:hypothetical protein
MRVVALYDIHGNRPALDAVLADVEREGVDRIVIGGDIVPGPLPVETLERLRALGDRAVLCEETGTAGSSRRSTRLPPAPGRIGRRLVRGRRGPPTRSSGGTATCSPRSSAGSCSTSTASVRPSSATDLRATTTSRSPR